jgi:uncharacterized membrane protein
MSAEHPSAAELAERLLGQPLAQLTPEQRRVIGAIAAHRPTARDLSDDDRAPSSFGTRLADRVAAVGGSWGFIIGFALVLFAWMLLNSGLLGRLGLSSDPYPFIFLNLMLSTLAAIQAPIIMMSQNRQSEKDRVAAAHDYEVNLRAELEVRRLHAKLDRLEAAIAALTQASEAKPK